MMVRYRLFIFLFFINAGLSIATPYRVLAFYTAEHDKAHISFVREANKWFSEKESEFNFKYESTDDWQKLNEAYLSRYDIIIFLDTRPETPEQRQEFENYMKRGGAWMGFHFAAFALDSSAYPNDWHWYQDTFLACGQYVSNTWRPTAAVLKVEDKDHPITNQLPERFLSSPNEWYRWEHDLRDNSNIEILLSIDPSSFPLGTGPKVHEIWHNGYYPVVWTNKNYNMIYFNMGHNDIDYEGGTNRELSSTFSTGTQNHLIINAMLWLLQKSKSSHTR
ncbi:MAG: ThuA domain-containing protein [Saprospiraceae bacterium]|nr:ThuA domain-containing protein [Saprospiraceae bacterium]